ncbi:MAG: glycosyl hydrolase family 28 protein [Bacteroidales bacterium]|nr:glycosyl hydrolase family 28 protein [Bacteroidales bacterium]
MKTQRNIIQPIFIIVILLCISCTTTSPIENVIFPAPDLSQIQGLEKSSDFALKINGKEAFVYHSFEEHDPYEWFGDAGTMVHSPSYEGVSFCNFIINEASTLEINVGEVIKSWNIKPEIKNSRQVAKNVIEVQLDNPRKMVLTAVLENGKEKYFIISAEEPETNVPNENSQHVLYFKAGVYKQGQAWDPFVNGVNTIYLEGGAVLEATIKSINKNNIKILGRGILAQAFVTHAEEVENRQEQEWDADWMGIHLRHSKNIEIDGITLVNSPGYQLELANCDSAIIKNVKLCGFGEHNNDGLHTYGRNMIVEDCLIAGNDDRICVTGLYDNDDGNGSIVWDGTVALEGTPVENITIRNSIFWGLHNNGGDIMLTWNGEDYCRNILVENCYSLSPTNKGFLASKHGGSAVFTNFRVENCHLYHGDLFSLLLEGVRNYGAGGGGIEDLKLKNITIDVPKAEIGDTMLGFDDKSRIDGLVLENIIASDGKLNSISETRIHMNRFVGNPEVR